MHLSFYSTWVIKLWSLYAMNFVCITFSTIIDLTTPSTILAAGNFAFFPFDFSCTKSQSLVCNTTLESSMQWIGWYLSDLIFWQVSPNHACQQSDFQWLCWPNYTLLTSKGIPWLTWFWYSRFQFTAVYNSILFSSPLVLLYRKFKRE